MTRREALAALLGAFVCAVAIVVTAQGHNPSLHRPATLTWPHHLSFIVAHVNRKAIVKCAKTYRAKPSANTLETRATWRSRNVHAGSLPKADPLSYRCYLREPVRLRNVFVNLIHPCEGSWRAATGNGYYGGLQMDLTFQRNYGRDAIRRWGTANNWPWYVQVMVAIRAVERGRGFYPWPTCARRAGLI